MQTTRCLRLPVTVRMNKRAWILGISQSDSSPATAWLSQLWSVIIAGQQRNKKWRPKNDKYFVFIFFMMKRWCHNCIQSIKKHYKSQWLLPNSPPGDISCFCDLWIWSDHHLGPRYSWTGKHFKWKRRKCYSQLKIWFRRGICAQNTILHFMKGRVSSCVSWMSKQQRRNLT